jgi:hypothetical protein
MSYLKNVWLWFSGFFKLGKLSYKPGWGPFQYFWLYLIDTGFNVVILANEVVTISRYTWLRRRSQPWKWLGETLDKISPNHIENAGDPLWGSVPNPPWQRIAVPVLWASGAIFAAFFK